MRWARILFLLGVTSLIALLIEIPGLVQPHSTLAARPAAPQAFTLYLPLVLRDGGAGCSSTQLLKDTSLEAGSPNPYWQVSGDLGNSIVDNSPIPPAHTGTWKAFLGGSNLAQESLWQSLAVPAGTSSLQLSFWFLVSTAEPNPLTYDHLDVEIRNGSGSPFQTVYSLYDGDRAAAWAQQSLTVAPAFAGQTIQLAFVAQTDATNPTSFFIDDVSLMACR